ncbi:MULTISPECIES: GNAT family N-acetyltransferase [unclassified Rhizobium]|uniref:GNAT family N-acetyltransferase n=1 Tax=unclassified Rhizobium TaxID=2613769 RepID=UPI001ADB439E|nr:MULTISPECIES: GNAT family N-acetyltransferase [unclassified Rhizobium]MBO9098827.1 GNAT family N-acetyltransferase [Rhizobium sp. L58/93]MBO9132368.1 GNAT family N-acetyltransferase [Rhizobium sp. B209b/85]MBO9169093.1 GNAT family N-acetyltransferase [Rhizobium sp. L245/93]MBO9185043.1 GNAT family N-acetyltransferase [Rhizobium sp. E27B/91]QXZ85195.1 GNAT family N-acetyltransferase [Rhizobium sp. K1/93]
MIILETDRLIIRNWREPDRDLFFEINSDETVMKFFPFRRDRASADAFFDHLKTLIAETGLGFYALESKATGETIGFCGLARTDLEPFIPLGTVEIGWRLPVRFWGQGFISEAATALLRHGFETLHLDEVVSFAVHNNHRSTAVMRRIGMHRDMNGDFDHRRVPDSRPELKRTVLYRLTADQWRDAGSAA